MARLRFPGRPGCRFDRLGVRYGVDEPRRGLDPTTRLIGNVHQGLRYFRELFGESDDEEFEGFSSEEINRAEAKLVSVLSRQHGSPLQISPHRRSLRSRDGLRDKSSTSTQQPGPSSMVEPTPSDNPPESEPPPNTEPTRVTRGRVTLRRIQDKLFQKGLAKPMNLSVSAKVQQIERKQSERKTAKLQKQKEKDEKLAQKAKERELKRQTVKLRPIKIRLGSDGNQAKIVRGPGRPSIYDKEGGKSVVETQPPETSEETTEESPEKKGNRRVHFQDEEPVTTRLRGRKAKVCVVPASKRVDKSVAKQLLAKAKKGKSQRLAGGRGGGAGGVEKVLEVQEGVESKDVQAEATTRTRSRQQKQEPVEQPPPPPPPPAPPVPTPAVVVPEKPKPALISPPRPRGSGFILPSVSSRSSRKIIPNKRFIESSDIYYTTGKSRNSLSGSGSSNSSSSKSEVPSPSPSSQPTTPAQTPSLPPPPPPPPKSQQKKCVDPPAAPPPPVAPPPPPDPVVTDADDDDEEDYGNDDDVIGEDDDDDEEDDDTSVSTSGMTTPISSPCKTDPQMETSPLIVAGKRDRKPSQKLIQKLSDDDALSILNRNMEVKRTKSDEKKRLSAGASPPPVSAAVAESPSIKMSQSNIDQLIAAGFSHGEIGGQKGKKQRKKDREMMTLERLGRTEAARRSGQNILRKAKFQLNRAALNRSKLALARSLKREMKREEKKLAQQKATEQLSVKTVGFGGFRSQPMSNMQLSPLKLTGFGQQGLGPAISQVPKFLESACLPTSPLLGAGLGSTVAGSSPSGEAFLFPKDSSSLSMAAPALALAPSLTPTPPSLTPLASSSSMGASGGATGTKTGISTSPSSSSSPSTAPGPSSSSSSSFTPLPTSATTSTYSATKQRSSSSTTTATTTSSSSSPHQSSSSSSSSSHMMKAKAVTKSYPTDVCAVCGANLKERKEGSQTLYYGIPCCPPCQWFYRRRCWQKVHENVDFVCTKGGNCRIDEKRSCVGCRYNRCLEILPHPDYLKLMGKEVPKEIRKKKGTVKSKKGIVPCDVALAASEPVNKSDKFENISESVRKLIDSLVSRPDSSTLDSDSKENNEKKDGNKVPEKSPSSSSKEHEHKLHRKDGSKKNRSKDGKHSSEKSKKKKERKLKKEKREKKLKRKSHDGEGKHSKVKSPKKSPDKKGSSLQSDSGSFVLPEESPVPAAQPAPILTPPTPSWPQPASSLTSPGMESIGAASSSSSFSDEYDEELAAILNSSRNSEMDFMFNTKFQDSNDGSDLADDDDDDDLDLPSTSKVSSLGPETRFSFGPTEGSTFLPPGSSGGVISSDEDNDVRSDAEYIVSPKGPRVKHVCRKVSVALGTPATFPARPEIRLSALSPNTKQKMWKREEQRRPGTPDSDDLSIEEIIRRARDHDDSVVHIKDNRAEARKLKALACRGSSSRAPGSPDEGVFRSPQGPFKKYKKGHFVKPENRKRKTRCKKCAGCRAKECGQCYACKDMVKFGGRGVCKKACLKRDCLNPYVPSGVEYKKVRKKEHDRCCDDPGDDEGSPGGGSSGGGGGNSGAGGGGGMGGAGGAGDGGSEGSGGSKRERSIRIREPTADPGTSQLMGASLSQVGQGGGGGDKDKDVGVPVSGDLRRSPVASRKREISDRKVLTSAAGGQSRSVGKVEKSKAKAKQQERSEVVALQSLIPASQRWAGGKHNYTIKADMRDNFDINYSWQQGVSLVSSGPMCVRTVCFLCGSAGKEELIYCNVCCEPFHRFCLDERERPHLENLENWCCRRCQFCHVCGKQNNLLCCDKCQNTYHPECLGPNYPANPSRLKRIWVCMKCVKCRSCGATTPGTQNGACWTHDFSLCYSCGQLMDKGNFCPICKKCYADDDWDCKMIQCSSCENWVHAKCEGLTDEMYQVLSFLPEEVAYNCRVCLPVHPAPWEQTIRREIHAGIAAVISSMVVCKSAQHLQQLEESEEEESLVCSPVAVKGPATHLHTPPQSDHKLVQQSLEELDPEVLAAAENLLQQVCEAEDAMNLMEASSKQQSDTNKVKVTGSKVTSTEGDLTRSTTAGNVACASATLPPVTTTQTDATNDGSVVPPTSSGNAEKGAEEGKDHPMNIESGAELGKTSGLTDTEGGATTSHGSKSSPDADCPTDNNCDSRTIVGSRTTTAAGEQPVVLPPQTYADAMQATTLDCDSSSGTERTRAAAGDIVVVSTSEASNKAVLTNSNNASPPKVQEKVGTASEAPLCSTGSTTPSMTKSSMNPCELSTSRIAPGDQPGAATPITTCSSSSSSSLSSPAGTSAGNISSSSNLPLSSVQSLSSSESLTCSTTAAAKTSSCEKSILKHHHHHHPVSSNGGGSDVTEQVNALSDVSNTTNTNTHTDLLLPSQDKPSHVRLVTTNQKQPTLTMGRDMSSSNAANSAGSSSGHHHIGEVVALPNNSVTTKSVHFELDSRWTAPGDDEDTEKTNSVTSDAAATSDRSPSATLTADEVAMDTLSDFGDFELQRVPDYISLSAFMPVKPAKPKVDYPKTLADVKLKVLEKKYRTVEEFNNDIVRIIQFNIKFMEGNSIPLFKKKATNSVQKLFVKSMKECFPWFSVAKSHLWDDHNRLPDGMLDDATVPPSIDHTYAQWLQKDDGPTSPHPSPFKKVSPSPHKRIRVPMDSLDDPSGGKHAAILDDDDGEDMRRCMLCANVGDEEPDNAGRLLYTGQDDWVHVNCALWSAEVFEEEDRTLCNVHTALSRGRQMKCDYCGVSGATVGCCCRGCPANYHFMCARRQRCIFQEDKKVFCRNHWDMMDGELIENNRFGVLRRTCISAKEDKFPNKKWVRGLNPNEVSVVVGSMTVESLGRLSPLSDTRDVLLPVDYCCTRVYWSTIDARRRCVYTCRVLMVRPTDVTPIQVVVRDMRVVHDKTHPEYDEQKLQEFTQLMESQRKAMKPRKRRKSSICSSNDFSDDSDDDDYIPSDDETTPKVPKWKVTEKPVSRPACRPRGLRSATNHTEDSPLPIATCGQNSRRQRVMTPQPGSSKNVRVSLTASVPTSSPKPKQVTTAATKPPALAKPPRVAAAAKPVLNRVGSAQNKLSSLSDEMLDKLGQESSLQDNEDMEVDPEVVPALPQQTQSNPTTTKKSEALMKSPSQSSSSLMKTLDLTEPPTRRRRLSHDSNASEASSTSASGALDSKQFGQLFQASKANTVEKKIDVLINYLGVSAKVEAPELQTTLERLQSHMTSNTTDQETSTQVSHLIQQVPDLLKSGETPQDESKSDVKTPLKSISDKIEEILHRVAKIPKPLVERLDEVEETSKSATMETGLNQISPVQSRSDQNAPATEEGNAGSVTEEDRIELEKLGQALGLGGLATEGADTPSELTMSQDSCLGLTAAELAAAESAMLKAQVDGKNDSDDDNDANNSPSKAKDGSLKSYPLRRTAARAAEASAQMYKAAASKKVTESEPKSNPELHLADKIAMKIKAESLARSSPGEDGPFKCPTCKRVYRTQESYCRHIAICDYWVSSDEEEEDEEVGGTGAGSEKADEEWSPEKNEDEPRVMRLRDNAARRSIRHQTAALSASHKDSNACNNRSRSRDNNKTAASKKAGVKPSPTPTSTNTTTDTSSAGGNLSLKVCARRTLTPVGSSMTNDVMNNSVETRGSGRTRRNVSVEVVDTPKLPVVSSRRGRRTRSTTDDSDAQSVSSATEDGTITTSNKDHKLSTGNSPQEILEEQQPQTGPMRRSLRSLSTVINTDYLTTPVSSNSASQVSPDISEMISTTSTKTDTQTNTSPLDSSSASSTPFSNSDSVLEASSSASRADTAAGQVLVERRKSLRQRSLDPELLEVEPPSKEAVKPQPSPVNQPSSVPGKRGRGRPPKARTPSVSSTTPPLLVTNHVNVAEEVSDEKGLGDDPDHSDGMKNQSESNLDADDAGIIDTVSQQDHLLQNQHEVPDQKESTPDVSDQSVTMAVRQYTQFYRQEEEGEEADDVTEISFDDVGSGTTPPTANNLRPSISESENEVIDITDSPMKPVNPVATLGSPVSVPSPSPVSIPTLQSRQLTKAPLIKTPPSVVGNKAPVVASSQVSPSNQSSKQPPSILNQRVRMIHLPNSGQQALVKQVQSVVNASSTTPRLLVPGTHSPTSASEILNQMRGSKDPEPRPHVEGVARINHQTLNTNIDKPKRASGATNVIDLNELMQQKDSMFAARPWKENLNTPEGLDSSSETPIEEEATLETHQPPLMNASPSPEAPLNESEPEDDIVEIPQSVVTPPVATQPVVAPIVMANPTLRAVTTRAPHLVRTSVANPGITRMLFQQQQPIRMRGAASQPQGVPAGMRKLVTVMRSPQGGQSQVLHISQAPQFQGQPTVVNQSGHIIQESLAPQQLQQMRHQQQQQPQRIHLQQQQQQQQKKPTVPQDVVQQQQPQPGNVVVRLGKLKNIITSAPMRGGEMRIAAQRHPTVQNVMRPGISLLSNAAGGAQINPALQPQIITNCSTPGVVMGSSPIMVNDTFQTTLTRQLNTANTSNVILQNNPMVAMVSSGMLTVNPTAPLVAPGSNIISQAALVQAGLLPNTAYVPSVNPGSVQLQTVNVLPAQQTLIPQVVIPSSLCLQQTPVRQSVSYISQPYATSQASKPPVVTHVTVAQPRQATQMVEVKQQKQFVVTRTSTTVSAPRAAYSATPTVTPYLVPTQSRMTTSPASTPTPSLGTASTIPTTALSSTPRASTLLPPSSVSPSKTIAVAGTAVSKANTALTTLLSRPPTTDLTMLSSPASVSPNRPSPLKNIPPRKIVNQMSTLATATTQTSSAAVSPSALVVSDGVMISSSSPTPSSTSKSPCSGSGMMAEYTAQRASPSKLNIQAVTTSPTKHVYQATSPLSSPPSKTTTTLTKPEIVVSMSSPPTPVRTVSSADVSSARDSLHVKQLDLPSLKNISQPGHVAAPIANIIATPETVPMVVGTPVTSPVKPVSPLIPSPRRSPISSQLSSPVKPQTATGLSLEKKLPTIYQTLSQGSSIKQQPGVEKPSQAVVTASRTPSPAQSPSPAKSLQDLSPAALALGKNQADISPTKTHSPPKYRVRTEYWSPRGSQVFTVSTISPSSAGTTKPSLVVGPPALKSSPMIRSPVPNSNTPTPTASAQLVQLAASNLETLPSAGSLVARFTNNSSLPVSSISPEKQQQQQQQQAGFSTQPTSSVVASRSIFHNLMSSPLPYTLAGNASHQFASTGLNHLQRTPSRSDRIILEELTGQKMDVEQAVKDSAAAAAMCNHVPNNDIKWSPQKPDEVHSGLTHAPPPQQQQQFRQVYHQYVAPTNQQQHQMKSLLTVSTPTMSHVVQNLTQGPPLPPPQATPNRIQPGEQQLKTPKVQIQAPPGVANPLIQWTGDSGQQMQSVQSQPGLGGVKRTVKKIIRKKIIIRKPNMLKRKFGELSPGQVPPAKKPCYIMVDNNGMLHSMSNNHTFSAVAPVAASPQQEKPSIRLGQVQPQMMQPPRPPMLKSATHKAGALMRSAHKEKRKIKLPVRKFPKLGYERFKPNPNFKVNPKLLKVSYSKENHQEGHDVLKRKKARKEAHKCKTDIGYHGQSHQVVHPHLLHPSLPQPEIEEEVVAIPALDMGDVHPNYGRQKAAKDAPHLVFEITSSDGFHIQSESWHEAWKAVTDRVQDARANVRMKQLSYSGINGLRMFGLTHSVVAFLIEQLYGAQNCTKYRYRFHDYRDFMEEPAVENPTGCARGEPFHTRKPRDMFSFLLSKYRAVPMQELNKRDEDLALKSQRRATSMELPMAMRFRHLRLHAKEAVGVYRSAIHGRGLFCKRDIDAGEMIIEYAGEVIRSIVTDKREHYYESKGIGCYMFRIDDFDVVDATVHGNAARFINHCCEPNCYSKVINVENKKHIIIFALRPIKKGEELTYDYKFPIEDVKIPCTCNAKRCRKYLN